MPVQIKTRKDKAVSKILKKKKKPQKYPDLHHPVVGSAKFWKWSLSTRKMSAYYAHFLIFLYKCFYICVRYFQWKIGYLFFLHLFPTFFSSLPGFLQHSFSFVLVPRFTSSNRFQKVCDIKKTGGWLLALVSCWEGLQCWDPCNSEIFKMILA